eukprot:3951846-Prymnesium_polylepis.1
MRPPDDDPCRLDCRAAPHVRMHDSSNVTAVESREEIAMESRFSRPLEPVVQARGREMMPLRFRDDLPRRQQRKRLRRLCKRR